MSPILDLTIDLYQAQRQNKRTSISNGSSTLLPKLMEN